MPEIRARLEARRAELEALDATARSATETVELDQARVGRLSRMDALQGQAMASQSPPAVSKPTRLRPAAWPAPRRPNAVPDGPRFDYAGGRIEARHGGPA
jgi:hypothetical protein